MSGSLVALGAWAVVAHSSGSGWVQTLGAIVAGVLVAGMTLPAVPAARARVRCTWSPADAVAGRPVEVRVEANGPLRLRPRSPRGPEVRAAGPPTGWREATLVLRPERRGVVDAVLVEVAASAPFGLLWWGRDVALTLPRPLHVAPRSGPEGTASAGRADRRHEGASPAVDSVGDPRGVRAYAPGDSRRAVHWPATAHAGSLMVRETERPAEEPVVVEALLPADPVAAEAACERAKGTACAWLARGRTVVLVTDEPGCRVRAPVRDRVEVGRRLARAVGPGGGASRPGREGKAPEGARGTGHPNDAHGTGGTP